MTVSSVTTPPTENRLANRLIEPPAPATSNLEFRAEAVMADYRVAYRSRQASLLGRREVLTGKGKFGIFGDGKEIPQLAMAAVFAPGDFRSGYYRDQTFMMALGLLSLEQFFAQLYAHADLAHEPSSGGRQMNGHFATRSLDSEGRWLRLTEQYNSSADMSPTASQMPRLLGLAHASRLYRELPELASASGFSRHGNEIAFGTIGDASSAEGLFWETVNAAGVIQAPLLLSIWDDGYGISVPRELQITKGDLSAVLSGFGREPGKQGGLALFSVKGWDYPALYRTYRQAAHLVRTEHVPAVVHVQEVTQPQGHSTSGSHERYKSAERLAWEAEFDGLKKMREWMLESGLVGAEDLERCEREDRERVSEAKLSAWKAFRQPIDDELKSLVALAGDLARVSPRATAIEAVSAGLLRKQSQSPNRRDLLAAAQDLLVATLGESTPERARLTAWKHQQRSGNQGRYSTHLLSESSEAALGVTAAPPIYAADAPSLNGFEVLNRAFDAILARDPRVTAFGEDVGKLGDVNQGFSGLQEKYGPLRVGDTGIREATILGQGIGMALRGLRPIAEIQYLDYVLYALQLLSDDLATLHWRTLGGQKAPVIVRTRGHRLEGIWHSGSPMAGILNLVRGVHFCVPRDMTRAAGFYNTLLAGDDPAIVVEVLNGYRTKELLPSNLAEMRVPLGVPEILRAGNDVTLVTYGACCRIALEAAEQLAQVGVEVEVLDVQTLLPFDRHGAITESLKKTNRILFLDEDVPGGATAFMMQQVIEAQGGFHWLDAPPRTLAAQPHRPAYGSDGDYFSKPNREDIFEAVYELVREADPRRWPAL